MAEARDPRHPGLEAALARYLDGQPVHAFESIGSTMEVAHALAGDGAPHGSLVWAQRQEQGRGRLGRTWESPKGGLYLSLMLRPNRPPAEIPQLSLVAGLAVAEATQELTGLFPSIRWPNDLFIGEQKVGGILLEAKVSDTFPASTSVSHRDRLETRLTPYVVIGIGINVTTDPRKLPETATSLAAHLRDRSTRRIHHSTFAYRFTGELCRQFHRWYEVWSAEGFSPIREALRPWIDLFGRPIHITAGRSRFEGTASDLDEDGRLLVRLDSGVVRQFEMGEVTLLR